MIDGGNEKRIPVFYVYTSFGKPRDYEPGDKARLFFRYNHSGFGSIFHLRKNQQGK